MEEKTRIRKQMFALRKQVSDAQVHERSEIILEKVAATEAYKRAGQVLAYVDCRHEVETGNLIRRCMADGKQVAVPKVRGQEMDFYQLTDFSQLEPGYFGIPEPAGGTIIDWSDALMIVPGVAFDPQCHRLGYGQGFYDRYLAAHRGLKTIALAFSFQIVPEAPCEETDILPQMVITEEETYFARQAETEPVSETERQLYYMKKCREYTEKRSGELGRPLRFCVVTFGCQMNARDSEKLEGVLEKAGYQKTEKEEDADFVIYNTCTVRENANLRVYGRLGYLHSLKKKNPELKIGLCGCMMQEKQVVEKIRKSYRFVSLIFGTHNLFKFAELLYQMQTSNKMIVDTWEDTKQIVENLPVDRKYSFKSGVNIMFGCNNFCSYCIVPYVRGREKSRKPEEILSEIRRLVDDGVVEIMLLGQNVNSYGKNLDTPVSFSELLSMVEQIDGLKRIRFMTSHPKDLSDELIEVMAKSNKICRHIHLPLQSGSSRILKLMNRKYDKEKYLALTEKIRRAMPDISITTDIIVGFPGETEEDFEETLDVVRKVRYDSAFTFIYSKRTGTPAAAMENQVPEDVVKKRFDRLLALVQDISREEAGRLEGQVQEVLVEGMNEQDAALVTGRMSNNLLVHFPGTPEDIGRLLPVHLDTCKGFYYMGTRC